MGEEGFSDTRIAVEKEILELRVKIPDKIHTFAYELPHGGKGRKAGGRTDRRIGIIAEGKVVKIFFLQDLTDIGLGVEEINDCLTKAVAFLLSDIAGILTVRTMIVHFKIIGRVTVGSEKSRFSVT